MTTANRKWYSVTLQYDAYYRQRVILQATTATRACDDAKTKANDTDAWNYADDISETYVTRIKASDSRTKRGPACSTFRRRNHPCVLY
ncbi:MAG: hypothetical protein ABS35_40925 [Kaistia sp. SCN 65-12]|nr:MAG: hypothetical protein ABS35_40925 [Kaistia sp. SCN 65-12]